MSSYRKRLAEVERRSPDSYPRVLNPEHQFANPTPCRSNCPPFETAADVTKALGTVLAAVATGEIDPDEAVQISAMLEIKRRSIELVEIEQRVTTLEERSQ